MKISAIKLFNIRSFLERDNYLTFEEAKTVIIGVNESGKSNILEALGNLKFTTMMSNYYSGIKNLSAPDSEVKILIQLSLTAKEKQDFGIREDEEKTLLTFKISQPTQIEGTLKNIIANNESVKRAVEFWDLHKVGEFYNINNDNRNAYGSVIASIKNCNNQIIDLSKLDILTRNFKKDIDSEECVSVAKELKESLSNIYIECFR